MSKLDKATFTSSLVFTVCGPKLLVDTSLRVTTWGATVQILNQPSTAKTWMEKLISQRYPLGMTHIAIENGPFIVDFPIKHGDVS